VKLWPRPSKRKRAASTTTESRAVEVGGAVIAFEVRRSTRRRKTVQVRVDRSIVTVAVPSKLSSSAVDDIVRKRADWIQRQLAVQPVSTAARQFISGETVPYLGRDVRIRIEPGDDTTVRVRMLRGSFTIEVPTTLVGDERREAIGDALEVWYRNRAAERIPASVERWSAVTGHEPSRVLIRNQKRRWATCGADGALRFNWRLVLAAPALLDYVVIHELAHLAVPNHSPAFWSEVKRWMPDHRKRRFQLRVAEHSMTR